MSISLAKALLGTLSVGASGLGAYGIYRLASPSKTIRQALQEDSTVIILDSNGDDSVWTSKVTELEDNTKDPVLEEYTKATGDDENAKKGKVKKICEKLLAMDSREGSKLKQAKKWCTKPKIS